jgi:23S rRNA (uracil-5-)-methyltransferase RumA
MDKICKHFGECGGCSFQDIPYPEQLRHKEEQVKELMAQNGLAAEVKAINYYPEWFYRNKMEFSFGHNGKITCGLYKKGNHREIVDIQECLIFSPDAGAILKAVKEFSEKSNYPFYDKFSYKGLLRNLVIRETKFSKELMIGLVATSAMQFDKEEFVKRLSSLQLEAKIKSIYLITNNSMSDAVVAQKKELLWGEPYIQEELGGLKFNIGIGSFFQVNPAAIKDFYAKIAAYAQLSLKEKVLDLFCGSGGIGMFLANGAKFVWGVELEKEVVATAWDNAKLNKIENISFVAAEVRKFLNTHSFFYKDADILVVNPPRPGLSHKIKRAILRLGAKTIFYSSCNPETLLRDIKELLQNYTLDFVEPFDFFPHTAHTECLAVLRKN